MEKPEHILSLGLWFLSSLKCSLVGHLGQLYSRSTSVDLCESSEIAAAVLTTPSQDVALRIKERVKALPLKHEERTKAAGIINGFIDPFISYLKEYPERPYFKEVTKLTTGSYYEFVKVSNSLLTVLIAS